MNVDNVSVVWIFDNVTYYNKREIKINEHINYNIGIIGDTVSDNGKTWNVSFYIVHHNMTDSAVNSMRTINEKIKVIPASDLFERGDLTFGNIQVQLIGMLDKLVLIHQNIKYLYSITQIMELSRKQRALEVETIHFDEKNYHEPNMILRKICEEPSMNYKDESNYQPVLFYSPDLIPIRNSCSTDYMLEDTFIMLEPEEKVVTDHYTSHLYNIYYCKNINMNTHLRWIHKDLYCNTLNSYVKNFDYIDDSKFAVIFIYDFKQKKRFTKNMTDNMCKNIHNKLNFPFQLNGKKMKSKFYMVYDSKKIDIKNMHSWISGCCYSRLKYVDFNSIKSENFDRKKTTFDIIRAELLNLYDNCMILNHNVILNVTIDNLLSLFEVHFYKENCGNLNKIIPVLVTIRNGKISNDGIITINYKINVTPEGVVEYPENLSLDVNQDNYNLLNSYISM
ncbi:hypothetical protein ApNV_016 [Aratus pisonii nudivirus]|nr:hypothetical protein ApNV_016 [Aratus pisonii nudivirus]